jgi:sortase A
MEKQRREWGTRRPKYAVYRRRRRNALLILVLLVVLVLGGLGAYLFLGPTGAEGSLEQPIVTPTVEPAPEAIVEETAAEKKAAEERAAEEEAERATAPAEDPTLFLTVPKLGIHGHTVRNDRSEAALDLGAVKLPDTGFPWEKEDTNTYIACHRLGWPGNESYNQCLNLPLVQQGDQIFLQDTLGRVYEYRVTEALQITPQDTWIKRPPEGKDVVSLQTCIETLGNIWTMGPNWTARYVVQAERVT